MTDVPLAPLELGLYVPVAPQEVLQLREIAIEAAGRVATYFHAEHIPNSVEPRQEFGITIASKSTFARYLGFRASSFNVEGFVSEVDQLVRPMETDGTLFSLERGVHAVTMNRAARRSVLVEFDERSPAMVALQERQEITRGILWRHARVMFPRGIESASVNLIRLGFIKQGHGQLSARQLKEIKRLTRLSVAARDLQSVSLGRMVIGTDYNTPLAGAAWPPSTRG